ncbi:MAG: C39 family peptidase [Chlamydiota bacterium]
MLPFFWILMTAGFSQTYEYEVSGIQSCELVWEQENTRPFDELIVSWNGLRPKVGKWTVWVSLIQKNEQSEYLKYAEWTPVSQRTFASSPESSFAKTYQDTVLLKEDGKCDGFSIKLTAESGADLTQLDSLYACISSLSDYKEIYPEILEPVYLTKTPLQSQIVLDHPRHRDLCSPTSLSTAINALSGEKKVDPLRFASQIHDSEFDIYGNWILNTAAVYGELNGKYRCHVERLADFSALHKQLMQGHPVVVSVKGKIPGAAQAYPEGHLICVIGYGPKTKKVHCIDPAFPTNATTSVSYDLNDFLKAWGTRRNLSYLFVKKFIDTTE